MLRNTGASRGSFFFEEIKQNNRPSYSKEVGIGEDSVISKIQQVDQ